MKLSISNIGWPAEQDSQVYNLMNKYSFDGLEIAPTRIFPQMPYDNLQSAKEWADNLKEQYGFVVSSMQSIWYGRQEKIFGMEEERQVLLEYTKKAIDFAAIIGCENLVFGCPANRVMPENADENDAIEFFKKIASYAASKGTVIGIEANPPIYNTNYINDTKAALELIAKVDSDGFRLNLDIGTMIQNEESIKELSGNVHLINHVHISEPGLKLVQKRPLHRELMQLLIKENYQKFISIEMGRCNDLSCIEETLQYIGELFK